jgi:hypothetical protein
LLEQKEEFAEDVAVALLALVAMLVAFQYRTLAKFAVLPPGAGYKDLETFIAIVRRKVILDPVDGLLCLLILVPIAYILMAELRHRRLTVSLSWIFADERRTFLSLAAMCLVSVRYYFAPGGLSWAGDAPQHISYLDITTRILSDFELPIWTNYFGNGSPFLQFYGFIYFLIAGVLNLFLDDVDLTTKLVLGLSHAASGIGVYYFCRALACSRRASFLAGLGYVLCFWHVQQVIVMGRHPVGLFYAFLPWPFVFLERCLSARYWLSLAVTGGVCLALLVLTHPGYGLYATAYLTLYLMLRCLELRHLASAYRGTVLVIVGLLLSAPHTLPIYIERVNTRLSDGWSLASTIGPTLQHLLLWSNYKFGIAALPPGSDHWYGGYLGISLLVIVSTGIVVSIQTRSRKTHTRYLALSLTTILAFLLPFVSSSTLLQNVPLIPNLSGGRYLLFTAFFMCASVGVGTRFLASPLFGRDRSRRFIILLGLVLLDLGPTTFQQPYGEVQADQDPNPRESWGELRNFRNFYTLRDHNPYNAMGSSQFLKRVPTAQAPHPGDLLAQKYFVEPFEESLTMVLPDSVTAKEWDRLKRFMPGFQMLNLKNVYLHRPQLAILDWHSPVLVSGRAAVLPGLESLTRGTVSQGALRERVEAMENDPAQADWISRFLALHWTLGVSKVDKETGSLANVVLTDGSVPVDLGTNPECEVVAHTVWNTRVHMRVRVTDQCFARLAYAYFPYLDVLVDGRGVEPLVTMGRFMAVQLDAGEHVIEIQATLSPLRKVLWLLDLLLLVGWFGWGRVRYSAI